MLAIFFIILLASLLSIGLHIRVLILLAQNKKLLKRNRNNA